MRLLILGGNRFIGAELVKRAVEQGHDVTVLSLGKPSIEGTRWLKANRDSSLSRLFAKLVFDTVIDNIAFRGPPVTSLIDALRDKVNRYVLTSSVDIYRNQEAKYCDERKDERLMPFLHSDTVPLWEAYVRGKRACEIALRASPYFEKVVVRPAVVIGARDNLNCPPEGLISRSLFFPLRIVDGGPILLRHTDTRLHQLAYVSDVAQAMLLAATHRLAAGQMLNVVGDEVWTNESLAYFRNAIRPQVIPKARETPQNSNWINAGCSQGREPCVPIRNRASRQPASCCCSALCRARLEWQHRSPVRSPSPAHLQVAVALRRWGARSQREVPSHNSRRPPIAIRRPGALIPISPALA